ncbi:peptide ligase PGM1-related protein [Saccharopolyspora dendranthemae]|uniref:ATP-grasp domain-containing protein n=1 Tax=Saccharopolyspora dendranthemae TaxID=1181886 RepID=A0A561U3B3_9PSEU|nr:peptide ligase PGM1-related protein [Saccharopolyspora dendranthemae]TWF93846.1 hypothetical protein FHU35_14119 [Saccharopolyspora dendranthemae]
MATVIISNQRTEEMVGDLELLDPDYRRYVGNQAMRMAWCLQEGDVLVLPMPADEEFLRYVAESLGIDRDSVHVIVPPVGRAGEGVLSRDRLNDERFLAELRAATTGGVDRVLPFHFDGSVAELTKALGLGAVTPGFGFLDQGGGKLLNSKSTFRSLAGGVDAAVPAGTVVSSQEDAEQFLWNALLDRGHPAILKQDFHVAGYGNEIVSPISGVNPIGAQRAVVVETREELSKYLADRWEWLTDGGRNQVVIEHYLPDSAPIYAEIRIEDHGVEFTGHGEMRMKPVLNGLIVPSPSSGTAEFDGFLDTVYRLGAAIHAMGYRGTVSVDAIVTADQSILINEFNCRTGGSTHIHRIGERIVGSDYFEERVLVELRRCVFPAFADALDALRSHGLAYDPSSRTGVLITVTDDSSVGGFGEYCVVARDSEQVERMEAAVAELFAARQSGA